MQACDLCRLLSQAGKTHSTRSRYPNKLCSHRSAEKCRSYKAWGRTDINHSATTFDNDLLFVWILFVCQVATWSGFQLLWCCEVSFRDSRRWTCTVWTVSEHIVTWLLLVRQTASMVRVGNHFSFHTLQLVSSLLDAFSSHTCAARKSGVRFKVFWN